MIAIYRNLFGVFLTLASLISPFASAGQIGSNEPDRILIADPTPALKAYLSDAGFHVESTERLEALDLWLTVATPPRGMNASAALHDLQAQFPKALTALDDRFYLARDTRAGRGKTVGRQRVFASMGWQPEAINQGDGLRIGAIDSSVDLAHPALANATILDQEFTSGNKPAKDTAHGTAIAAMLVGDPENDVVSGLLSGATLFHASIFRQSRMGPLAGTADFLRAVDWLIKSGVTVINASITSPTRNPIVLYAMTMVAHNGIVLVAAAGNGGPKAAPVYPAAVDSAFAVTAVSVDGDAYRYANTGDYIDISAPGVDLPTVSRTVTSGTSLAVPFVTAAVARLTKGCGVSWKEAEASLQLHARDLGPSGRDSHFGWGLVQAPNCGSSRTQLSATGR